MLAVCGGVVRRASAVGEVGAGREFCKLCRDFGLSLPSPTPGDRRPRVPLSWSAGAA